MDNSEKYIICQCTEVGISFFELKFRSLIALLKVDCMKLLFYFNYDTIYPFNYAIVGMTCCQYFNSIFNFSIYLFRCDPVRIREMGNIYFYYLVFTLNGFPSYYIQGAVWHAGFESRRGQDFWTLWFKNNNIKI